MEDIGFLQIVDLVRPPDEVTRRKASAGKMFKKDGVRQEAGNGDDRPAGRRCQPGVEFTIVGYAGAGEAQHIKPAQEGVCRTAGEHLRLAGKEPVPHGVVVCAERVPILRDRPVRRRAGR